MIAKEANKMNDRMTKNYATDGGDTWVIGGKLVVKEDAEVEGLEGSGSSGSYTLPAASASTLGGVKVGSGLSITDGVLSADGVTPAAAQAALESTAELADVITAFNGLLAALKTAGIVANA